MKKIGFLVQGDFLTTHFGVRNYFSSIMSVCAEEYEVDYLIHELDGDGLHWFICDVEKRIENEESKSTYIEYNMGISTRTLRYQDFRDYQNKSLMAHSKKGYLPNADAPKFYLRSIGTDLYAENYDMLIITNPWQIDFNTRLPAKKVIGIVHDLIPNEFAITKTTFDFKWAHEHNRGYQYYNHFCDKIIANSKATANSYNIYYLGANCTYFPPFMPYTFKKAQYQNEKKEMAIVLAAPFDIRKGIKSMPDLINGATDLIDVLYIFGMPRCSEEMFNEFFVSLKVKKIIYYPYIENHELISLYKKCKLLLFPSTNEGLGIPLMEAQICGCRVVTTNKEPMNYLAGTGAYLLGNSLEENIKNIRDMLCDNNFDYRSMSLKARKRFSHNNVLQVIDQILNNND